MLLDIIPERVVLRAFITLSRGHVRTLMMGNCCSMPVCKRRRERVPISTPKWGEHEAHQLLRGVFLACFVRQRQILNLFVYALCVHDRYSSRELLFGRIQTKLERDLNSDLKYMNISVCSPSIYTQAKGSSKGYLFTDISNVAHNLCML